MIVNMQTTRPRQAVSVRGPLPYAATAASSLQSRVIQSHQELTLHRNLVILILIVLNLFVINHQLASHPPPSPLAQSRQVNVMLDARIGMQILPEDASDQIMTHANLSFSFSSSSQQCLRSSQPASSRARGRTWRLDRQLAN